MARRTGLTKKGQEALRTLRKAKKAKVEAVVDSLDSLIAEQGFTHTAEEVDENPNYPPGVEATHWFVTIRSKLARRRKLEVYYSQTPGFQGEPPKLTHVLGCLAIDSNTFESAGTFESWRDEFGYTDSTDGDRSRRIYDSIADTTERLKKFIGDDAVYARLLACGEGS